MSKYRHEYKYQCTVQKLECIRVQISAVMYMDSHTDGNDIYTIRSLYFDNYGNECFYQNINGTDPREKFRIRIYNGDSSYIRLECKQKEHGKTKKDACDLPVQLCHEAMAGRPLPIQAVDSPVYRKFCLEQNLRMLRPKVIVEYERTPFIYPDGNVRVTFDQNIRSSNRIECFLNARIAARAVMPAQQHLLEVKFDEYLPDFIKQSIQTENLQLTTFSKYVLCRRYNMGGIIL